jgi:acetyltransferase-like isoleucine patch superfamily enzyme
MRPGQVLSILRKAAIVPIHSGTYCFVGSNCVILGGTVLPNHCVLGALSLLNKAHSQSWGLYAGQPAQWRKPMAPDAAYFSRERGFVL